MRPEDRLRSRLRLYLNAVVPAPPEATWSAIEHGRMHHGTDEERGREWGRLAAQGVKRGLPDAFLVWCMKFVAFEMKVTTRLRPEQKQFCDAWTRNGGIYIEARSIVEVHEALRSAGLPIQPSMRIAAMQHDAALSVPEKKKRRGRSFDFSGETEAAESARRLAGFLDEG